MTGRESSDCYLIAGVMKWKKDVVTAYYLIDIKSKMVGATGIEPVTPTV